MSHPQLPSKLTRSRKYGVKEKIQRNVLAVNFRVLQKKKDNILVMSFLSDIFDIM